MLADEVDFAIGVDPHRDQHALAVVTSVGGVVEQRAIPASSGGYEEALAFARAHAPGRRLWAVEGTGSYGRGLVRFLESAEERVVEVGRLAVGGRAKSDDLDAVRAARSVLGRAVAGQPRGDGRREALRVLLIARQGAISTRRVGLQQLRALLITAADDLRHRLAPLGGDALVKRCLTLRPPGSDDPARRATLIALRTTAQRIQRASEQARSLEHELRLHVQALAPALLDEPGIATICAAQILVSWSHPGRIRSAAAFAQLAGTAPIPASSGQIVRYRLNRGGDRTLNRTLHTIVVCRRQTHPPTRAYVARRLAEGKTMAEITRCLKRYLARNLHRQLTTMTT